MRVHFTVDRLPTTGALKDQCGLPFACVVQPFALESVPDKKDSPGTFTAAEDLARCSACYAYINRYCSFQTEGWTCAICGYFNEYSSLKIRRYARSQARRLLPELQSDIYEVQCALEKDPSGTQDEEGQARLHAVDIQPVYLALIDMSCNEEFMELIKSALSAALEAVPPAARFGLVTFSTKVGLYDMRGGVPAVRFVPLVEDGTDSPTPLDLQDALPLEALLVPVASCKDSIAATIDCLRPEQPSPSEATLDLHSYGTTPSATRGFGSALQAVLRYLGTSGASDLPGTTSVSGRAGDKGPQTRTGQASTSGRVADGTTGYAGARLMAFLAGPANYGRGAVVRLAESASDGQHAHEDGLPLYNPSFLDVSPYSIPIQPQGSRQQPADPAMANGHPPEFTFQPDERAKAFYEEAAVAAAALGVCVDMYVASPLACGLRLMEPLASSSGGALHLYPMLEHAALPQDVYRRLSSSYALNGLLRIRTSSEFRIARSYGQLFQDEQYENLVHVVACDPSTSFAFDFEYATKAGFSEFRDNPPMLQVAFQYSVVQPSPADQDTAVDQQQGFVLQRRLRIATLAAKVASSIQEVYASANPDAVLTMLMHKIGRAADAEGPQEARALLQDWLVLFCARFNSHAAASNSTVAALTNAAQVDVAFQEAASLQPIPRLVYALLRSPLLAVTPPAHPDLRAAVHHLWASLPPEQLRCAIYPVLASYTDPDTQARSHLALSRAALITAAAPIFLMDSFTALVVYYSVGYPSGLPFPPPQQSLLRKTVNALRQKRRPTPSLRMLRGGIDDAQPFVASLLEEPELDDNGRTVTPGFAEFLEQVKGNVWSYMLRTAKR